MQEKSSIIISRMNRAYHAMRAPHSQETRRVAEQTFESCQNELKQRGIAFHQTPDGQWVLTASGEQHETEK